MEESCAAMPSRVKRMTEASDGWRERPRWGAINNLWWPQLFSSSSSSGSSSPAPCFPPDVSFVWKSDSVESDYRLRLPTPTASISLTPRWDHKLLSTRVSPESFSCKTILVCKLPPPRSKMPLHKITKKENAHRPTFCHPYFFDFIRLHWDKQGPMRLSFFQKHSLLSHKN